jgi:hypothetical protein
MVKAFALVIGPKIKVGIEAGEVAISTGSKKAREY